MPRRGADSSSFWKSISTTNRLSGARAPTYSLRMVKEQRVAIVTGASQGIGAGLVAGYRGLGFGVVATAPSIAPSGGEQVLAIRGGIRGRATARKRVQA